MKVSIALDGINKFETELPDNKAKELFNDFVLSAMSNSNKQVQEIELSEPCYADEEEDDNFNTVEYFARREVGYKGNPRRMKSYPILKGFVYLECAKCGRRHGFCIDKEMTHYRCDDCGYDTIIDKSRLRKIKLECEICGKSYLYTTNMTEEKPQMQCFSCGDIKNLFYFKRDNIYYIDKEV